MSAATTTTTSPRAKPRARRVARQSPLPCYGVADGVYSLRSTMTAGECGVVDRALSILGARLRDPGGALDDPRDMAAYLKLQIGGDTCERFSVLYLDAKCRALAYECHFTGTLTQTSVYPRAIVEAAFKHRAVSVVLAHNHPSGSVTPSRADEALTQTLKAALALIDVSVLDHIIVGGDKTLSMAEKGFM